MTQVTVKAKGTRRAREGDAKVVSSTNDDLRTVRDDGRKEDEGNLSGSGMTAAGRDRRGRGRGSSGKPGEGSDGASFDERSLTNRDQAGNWSRWQPRVSGGNRLSTKGGRERKTEGAGGARAAKQRVRKGGVAVEAAREVSEPTSTRHRLISPK